MYIIKYVTVNKKTKKEFEDGQAFKLKSDARVYLKANLREGEKEVDYILEEREFYK